MTWTDVENLKSEHRYRHAGALAFIIGNDAYYGCHYGMRNTLDHAKDEFNSGYYIAQHDWRAACAE
jgi:hypothetical protein